MTPQLGNISHHNVCRMLNMKETTCRRLRNTTPKKRRMIRDGDKNGFEMISMHRKRSKYDTELNMELRQWMLENKYLRDIGNKKETIIQRDINGQFQCLLIYI